MVQNRSHNVGDPVLSDFRRSRVLPGARPGIVHRYEVPESSYVHQVSLGQFGQFAELVGVLFLVQPAALAFFFCGTVFRDSRGPLL